MILPLNIVEDKNGHGALECLLHNYDRNLFTATISIQCQKETTYNFFTQLFSHTFTKTLG